MDVPDGRRPEELLRPGAKSLRELRVQVSEADALAGTRGRERGGVQQVGTGPGAPVLPVSRERMPVHRRLSTYLMGPARLDPDEPQGVRAARRDRLDCRQGAPTGIRRPVRGPPRHPMRPVPDEPVVPGSGDEVPLEQRDVSLEYRSVAERLRGRLRPTQGDGEDHQTARIPVETMGGAGAKAHPVGRTAGEVGMDGIFERSGSVGELAAVLVHHEQVPVLMDDAPGKRRATSGAGAGPDAGSNNHPPALERLGELDGVAFADAGVAPNAATVDRDLSGTHRAVDAAERHLGEQSPNHPIDPSPVVVRTENRSVVPGRHAPTVPPVRPVDKGRAGRHTQNAMEARTVTALYNMVSGPVFLSAFFSWFIAQFLKTMIDVVRHRSRTSGEAVSTMFWKTGGMPSSHSSLVTALATSIGFEYGAGTPIFTLSLFYGVLIIRDALGVRRSSGLQARALNEIGAQLVQRFGISYRPVKEISGHTPTEVTVGVALGFFIAVAFSLL